MRRKLALYAVLGLSPLCLALTESASGQPSVPPELTRLALPYSLEAKTPSGWWTTFITNLPISPIAGSTSAVPGAGGACATVSVSIYPATWSFKLVHNAGHRTLDDVPNGLVLALITNNSLTCPVPFLNLKAGEEAFWVAREETAGDNKVYKSYFVDENQNSLVGAVSFDFCRHVTKTHTQDSAAIKAKDQECVDTYHAKLHRKGLDGAFDAAVWLACSSTCCYADGLPQLQALGEGLKAKNKKPETKKKSGA